MKYGVSPIDRNINRNHSKQLNKHLTPWLFWNHKSTKGQCTVCLLLRSNEARIKLYYLQGSNYGWPFSPSAIMIIKEISFSRIIIDILKIQELKDHTIKFRKIHKKPSWNVVGRTSNYGHFHDKCSILFRLAVDFFSLLTKGKGKKITFLGPVWKLKSPSGLKRIGEEISLFPPQSPPIPKGVWGSQSSPSCAEYRV
jgi:hypothetical protein